MWYLQNFKIHFFVLLFFLMVQVDVYDATVQDLHDNESLSSTNQKTKIAVNVTDQKITQNQNNSQNVKTSNNSKVDSKTTGLHNLTSKSEEKPVKVLEENPSTQTEATGSHPSSLDAGALKRGFYVLIGLGVIVVAYFVFRSFRINNTRTQMIRKYGVLTHRQDVEMRPLPLDEDEDDDTTVFDANSVQIHKMMNS